MSAWWMTPDHWYAVSRQLNDADLDHYEIYGDLVDDHATHFCDDVEPSYDLDSAPLPWRCGRQPRGGDEVYDANGVTYDHG